METTATQLPINEANVDEKEAVILTRNARGEMVRKTRRVACDGFGNPIALKIDELEVGREYVGKNKKRSQEYYFMGEFKYYCEHSAVFDNEGSITFIDLNTSKDNFYAPMFYQLVDEREDTAWAQLRRPEENSYRSVLANTNSVSCG